MNSGSATQSYWIVAHVRLHAPVPSGDRLVAGHYRLFGLWSTPEEVRDDLAAETSDGVIDWEETTVELRRVSDVEEDIRKLAVVDQRVWYRSGRLLYPAPEDGG